MKSVSAFVMSSPGYSRTVRKSLGLELPYLCKVSRPTAASRTADSTSSGA